MLLVPFMFLFENGLFLLMKTRFQTELVFQNSLRVLIRSNINHAFQIQRMARIRKLGLTREPMVL